MGRNFVHPGGIMTINDLNRVKQHVEAKDAPWYPLFTDLQKDAYGNMSRTARGASDIGGSNGNRQRASGDAYAALVDAIEWHVTGNTKYADHAVKMLNAWGSTVKTANDQLFQLPSVTMTLAAEMLRNSDGSFYSGWVDADKAAFLKMVREVLYPACKSQAETNTMTSWSAPAAAAVMGAGILLDDETIYNEGLAFFKDSKYPGSVSNSIAEDGQCKEMGRDNVHCMLALNALAEMAQMAWIQGDDLYGYLDNRLLKGFEYWCDYNIGHEDVYYKPVGNWYYISTHNNAFRLAPDGTCFECVYHHYQELKGMNGSELFPNLTAFTKLARPEVGGDLANGTLLYTIDAATSPYWTTVPQTAEGVTAQAGADGVWLSWNDNGLNDASGFKILRAEEGKDYKEIVNWQKYTRKAYKDVTAEAGKTYSYQVVAFNHAGDAPASTSVTAATPQLGGLPNGWSLTGIGNGAGQAFFTNNMGNSFVVTGTGNGFRRHDEGHVFVYHKLNGDGSLVARLSDWKSDFKGVGLMLRNGLASGSTQMGLSLEGAGLRYLDCISRINASSQTEWKTGDDFTYAPVWLKLSRKGKTVTVSQSRDGKQWFDIQQLNLDINETVYVGFQLAADKTSTAYFDHVELTQDNPTEDAPVAKDLTATCLPGNIASLVWTGVYGAEKYIVYRRGKNDNDYEPVGETTTNSFRDTGVADGDYVYTVKAVVNGVAGEACSEATVNIHTIVMEPLTGTVIGTEGAWDGKSTRDKVFDDDLSTFFDAPKGAGEGTWVGMDLGEGFTAQVNRIAYCPRWNYAGRTVEGVFQGANKADFSDAVQLYQITTTPEVNMLTNVDITVTGQYRYLRYVSPKGSNGNIAEVKFYGQLYKNGVPTGVIMPNTIHKGNTQVYNLNGRYLGTRIGNNIHGVFIIRSNGKTMKVVR
uniref:alginate lyase family protein n=1 Tax=Prevotella sp. TaxID=59823 RepID=UPI004029C68A